MDKKYLWLIIGLVVVAVLAALVITVEVLSTPEKGKVSKVPATVERTLPAGIGGGTGGPTPTLALPETKPRTEYEIREDRRKKWEERKPKLQFLVNAYRTSEIVCYDETLEDGNSGESLVLVKFSKEAGDWEGWWVAAFDKIQFGTLANGEPVLYGQDEIEFTRIAVSSVARLQCVNRTVPQRPLPKE